MIFCLYPTLGRFLQADPFIQAPYNTQSLNRYSYVLNNPLNATDPSGYFANWLIAAVIGYVVSDIIITIGINSGWSSDLIQVVSFVANCWINACFDVSNLGQSVSNVFSTTGLQMGIIGGITSVLSGGKFGHGFVSAGIAAGGVRPSSSGGSSGSSTVSPQEFIGRTILGGTISKITGGKFANGAVGAAFAMMVQMVASGSSEAPIEPATGSSDPEGNYGGQDAYDRAIDALTSDEALAKETGSSKNHKYIDEHKIYKKINGKYKIQTLGGSEIDGSIDDALSIFNKENGEGWGIVVGKCTEKYRCEIYRGATAESLGYGRLSVYTRNYVLATRNSVESVLAVMAHEMVHYETGSMHHPYPDRYNEYDYGNRQEAAINIYRGKGI